MRNLHRPTVAMRTRAPSSTRSMPGNADRARKPQVARRREPLHGRRLAAPCVCAVRDLDEAVEAGDAATHPEREQLAAAARGPRSRRAGHRGRARWVPAVAPRSGRRRDRRCQRRAGESRDRRCQVGEELAGATTSSATERRRRRRRRWARATAHSARRRTCTGGGHASLAWARLDDAVRQWLPTSP
jgi:hypothetical protein